jgi:hypothetical protein
MQIHRSSIERIVTMQLSLHLAQSHMAPPIRHRACVLLPARTLPSPHCVPVCIRGNEWRVRPRSLSMRIARGIVVQIGGDPSPTTRGVFASGPDGFGATPTWQLTATACDDSFPAAQLVMQACIAVCSRKYVASFTQSSDATTVSARLRWEGCTTPFPRRGTRHTTGNATLDIDIDVSVTGGVSVWGATVGKSNAQGVCLQSLTIPDLRTLRANTSETVVYPYMFGAESNCSSPSPVATAAQLPEVGAAGSAVNEQGWMPNGWERTMSWTAWTSGKSGGSSAAREGAGSDNINTTGSAGVGDGAGEAFPVGLYVGSHDAASRLKMMPVYCSGLPGDTRVAGLRAVHVPDTFGDASTNDFTLPYPVVIASFRGGWWDAAQIYRDWTLTNATWTSRGNLSQRTEIPKWVLDAPMWVRVNGLVNGTSGNMAAVDKLRTFLGQDSDSTITDIGVHWYSWNQEAFDTHYPVYTPRDGFGAAVSALQQPLSGVTARVVPYTNGRLWDPAGPLPHAQASAATCNGVNGTPYHETYGSGVHFNVMDPASEYMQSEWSDVVGVIGTSLNTSGVCVSHSCPFAC